MRQFKSGEEQKQKQEEGKGKDEDEDENESEDERKDEGERGLRRRLEQVGGSKRTTRTHNRD
jgi:hypothetical protein